MRSLRVNAGHGRSVPPGTVPRGTVIVRSQPPHEKQHDDNDQNDAEDPDPTVTVTVAVATETAAEAAEQRDDKDDDENESERHRFISLGWIKRFVGSAWLRLADRNAV